MTKNEAFSAYPDVARFMNKEAYIEIESEEDRLELGEVFNAVGAYWDKGLSKFISSLTPRRNAKNSGGYLTASQKIDKFFPSSQLCSDCEARWSGTKDLSVREWICPECGIVHNRDVNAARNILQEGQRILCVA